MAVRAKWTVAKDGRHAVELEPKDSSVIALYRFFSPMGRQTFYIEVTLTHPGGHRYNLEATIYTPALVGRRRVDTLRTAFPAYDEASAATVVRTLSRAWAVGRIPLTPGNAKHGTAWRLYIDSTADAVMVRRARALRP